MAATVQIVEKNGTAGTNTQKDSGTVRFKNADNATVDTVNPMVIPTAGVDYSFEKWLRLKVTVGPSSYIENLTFYTDGANGFGESVVPLVQIGKRRLRFCLLQIFHHGKHTKYWLM